MNQTRLRLRVRGAQNANFGYNQIVLDCKSGEQVMSSLASVLVLRSLSNKHFNASNIFGFIYICSQCDSY